MELPTIKIGYELRVTDIFEDGFKAELTYDKRLIKYKNLVKDKVVLKNHSFKKKDIVNVTLELAEKKQEDIIEPNKIVFYIMVHQTLSNGISTKKEYDNPWASLLWYQTRGMITSEPLENNPFEIGDLIKVTLRRNI